MIIWTIQPYSVYQELVAKGHFYCDPNKSCNLKEPDFQAAYAWMIAQLKAKVGLPPNDQIQTPIWAWYRARAFSHTRPDFREHRDYADQVCLELELDDSQVLLSDFDSWHFVLGDSYFAPASNEQEWEELNAWFDGLTKKDQQAVKEASWQQIFDITPSHDPWTLNGAYVQACFWQLELSQVRKVWRMKKGEKVREFKLNTEWKWRYR